MACGTADGSTRYPRVNHLYRNNSLANGNPNHWLKVKLNGQASNRSGIGAKVRVKATIGGQEIWQLRELTGNGYSQTCPGLIAHFGLGDATQAGIVRVEWPSGNVQELTNVAPDQSLTVSEQVRITPVRPSSSLGGSVTLTAQLNGTWQWYHDGVAVDGEAARTLTLSNIQATDAGRYSVVVTTASGTFTNHVYLLVDTQFERIEMGDTVQSWGAAWGDFNNDNYPDLIVCNGQWVSTGTAALYRNNQDGTLVRTTPAEVGPLVELVRNWEHAHWGDYDNDGYLDLIASDNNINPRPSLWRNLGNGRFEETTTLAGSFLEDRLWGIPIWGDFNRDGLLDLAVANTSDEPPQWPDWCRNLLYFNRGDGTFQKDTQNEFVQLWRDFNTEGGSAGDFDNDGDLDIMITSNSNRPVPSTVLLFENDGTGQFHQAAFPTVSGASSTAVWADYDNDGRLDVFVVSWDRTSQLFHNEGNGQWTATSLGAPDQTLSAAWADYDNDGDLDLFIARGFNKTTTCLFFANNGDGTFTQVTLGSLPNHPGRSVGAAWADYDNNGFQDLFVPGARDFREVLYRNHGNGNHWISFKLVGTCSNRSAIAAKVRVYATIFGKTYWQMREVGGASRQQNDQRPHFGLGDALRATTVRVEWPSGTVEEFSNLARDQFHTIVEPSLRGAMKPNGEIELSVLASTNRTCTIESSGDLATWTVLTTVTCSGETPVTVTDPDAPGQAQRFYRMK
jgi:enediyne biosynthesis protein E4